MKKKLLSLVLAVTLCLGLCTQAMAYNAAEKDITSITATGLNQTAVIDENGSLWMWGNNDYGQLGNGGTGNMANAEGGYIPETDEYYTTYYQTTPIKVLDGVASVSAGSCLMGNGIPYNIAAAVRTDGTLWTWGFGALGNGNQGDVTLPGTMWGGPHKIQTVPAKIMDNVAAVSVGGYCRLAIKTNGTLWAWGDYGDGENDEPVKVMDDVVSACAGPMCAAAIKSDGSLWMWGTDYGSWNDLDSLGLTTTPSKIMGDAATVSIGSGGGSAVPAVIAVVKTDGSLWMWGDNGFNLFSDDTVAGSSTPVKVMDNVADVSTGAQTIAVKTDGSVWTWGDNSCGQLGIGTTENSSIPVQVAGLMAKSSSGESAAHGGFADVAADDYYAEAVLWAVEREITNGTTETTFSPEQTCTTAQILTFLWRAYGEPEPSAASPFENLTGNEYYYKAALWACENGMADGTIFEADTPCTRSSTVTYLWKAPLICSP